MNKREKQEQSRLPPCPNPDCRQSHVVRNGSHRGRQRYHCRICKTYFGETQGTPMYGLKTPAAEVAQALLIVMRRGSLRAAEEITGHKYETISVWLKRAATHAEAITQVLANDLHLSQIEIDEFWSFVQKKTAPGAAGRGRTLGMPGPGSGQSFRGRLRHRPLKRGSH
jgi:transposase-like protein